MPERNASHASRRSIPALTGAGFGAAVAVAAFVSMRGGFFTRGAAAEFVRPALEAGALDDGIIEVPGEARSLQDALDCAPDGSTVRLAGGTYACSAALAGKGISIEGAGEDATVLRGLGRGPVLALSGGVAQVVRVSGLSFEGGAGDGCGLRLEGVSFSVRGVRFAGLRGGGVRVQGAAGEFVGCTFDGNRSPASGGAVRSEGGSARFVGCTFSGNVSEAFGGAVASEGGRVDLIACTLSGNATHSGAWGGAVYGSGAQVELHGSDFERNRAIDSGGAVFLSGGTADVSRCSFSGNSSAEARSLFSRGAGVRIAASRLCGTREVAVGGDLVLGDGTEFDMACHGDCNQNGTSDSEEIELGWADDRDGNGMPDSCDPDCNMNGLPDAYEIGAGFAQDANANGLVDLCEIRAGLALDVDNDWIPDDAQVPAMAGMGAEAGTAAIPEAGEAVEWYPAPPSRAGSVGGHPVALDPWGLAGGAAFPR